MPLTRRPRYATWLTAAAALVAVGVLGVVVVNSRGGDDQMTSSDAGEDATEQLSDSRLTESAPETLAASDAADTDAAAAATIAADDAMAASEAAEATLDMAADDGSTGGAAGDAADSAPMSEMAIDPSLFFDLPGQLEANTSPLPITSIDELTSAIGYLLDLAERGELGPTPETRCPYPVLAEGVVLIGTTPDDVFVAALVDDDLAIALDRDSCDIVLEAPIGRR